MKNESLYHVKIEASTSMLYNNINWYKKYIKTSHKHLTKVKASDYYKFHKQLLLGIKDMDLLNKMIYDLLPSVKYVIRNSHLRHFYNYGKICDNCNTQDNIEKDVCDSLMEWYDENEYETRDFENEGCLSKEEYAKIIKKHPYGFWKCCNCGKIDGWWETLEKTKDENGKWMYTDAYPFLEKKIAEALNSKDFGDKHAAFEAIIEFAHMSGPQANWFIEGGSATIDKVRNMT